jgi:hypothetical protein
LFSAQFHVARPSHGTPALHPTTWLSAATRLRIVYLLERDRYRHGAYLRQQMPAKSNRLPILGTLYCLTGHVMMGSIASTAGEPQPYARAAVLWAVGAAASLSLAAAMAVIMRKRHHARG